MVQKNPCMFEFPAFLLPTNLGLPMHSPLALMEHVSLNLARILFARPCRGIQGISQARCTPSVSAARNYVYKYVYNYFSAAGQVRAVGSPESGNFVVYGPLHSTRCLTTSANHLLVLWNNKNPQKSGGDSAN